MSIFVGCPFANLSSIEHRGRRGACVPMLCARADAHLFIPNRNRGSRPPQHHDTRHNTTQRPATQHTTHHNTAQHSATQHGAAQYATQNSTQHNTQRTARSKQHTTRTPHNTQRTAHNTQRTAHFTQHPTHYTQHTTHYTQHTSHKAHHTTHLCPSHKARGVKARTAFVVAKDRHLPERELGKVHALKFQGLDIYRGVTRARAAEWGRADQA